MKNKLTSSQRIGILALLIAVVLIVPLSGQIKIAKAPNRSSLTYTSGQDFVQTETVSIRYKGPAITYFITFSSGQSGDSAARSMSDGAGGLMDYQIYDAVATKNILKDFSDPTLTEVNVLNGDFPDSGKSWLTNEHTFDLLLPFDQFPPAGQYSDTIIISLYTGDLNAPLLEDSGSMTVTSKMDKILEISLIPTGAAFDPALTSLELNFGALVQGAIRTGDFTIRSNSYYTVNLNSTNGGIMTINDPADTSTVPYSFSFNGQVITLSAGTDVPIIPSDPPSTAFGTRYPIEVEILDYGMATEGTYLDSLTFTVTAN